ncbi:MAG TPA: response regulator [Acetobacteraceae bacterium]
MHDAQEIALHRVANLPLVVSVGVAIDKSRIWWLVWTGAAGAVAAIVLALWAWRQTRARQTAERESKEKSRFLSDMSHELRTPLQGVLAYADRLSLDPSLAPAQAHDVNEIVRAGKQMRSVVNKVLDYARIEALGPALHPQRLEISSLIEECMAVIEPGARARGLTTRITVDPGAPRYFVTDGNQLRHILANLLSNAVKYTPSGMVECRLGGDSEHLTIEVADTGLGIPPAKRHRLFKEFERFGTERTGIEGTGLGLSIAHRLARRMGGHMGHRDNAGAGSVFWLELPAATAEEPDTRVESARTVSDRCLSLLVVDDSDINREVTASFLRTAGHGVREARNGAEAVQIAAAEDFDLVLMDMRMPGLDGLEATRAIRALEGSRGSVPIVAITANALDHHAEECRRAGMSEHLAKPFTRIELLAVVARAAAHRPFAPRQVSAIDPDAISQLVASVGESAVGRLFDELALRIESLLRQVEDPTATTSHEHLADLAHELIGSAGTLGFKRLAEAATRYEAMLARGDADSTEIRRAALTALSELQRRRSLETLLAH